MFDLNKGLYQFRGFYIPAYMGEGLMRYIEHGIEPGSFLMAVLNNDLAEAIGRADERNMANLPAYVSYLWNEAPSTCWGSSEKVTAWIKQHADARIERGMQAVAE